MTNGNGLAGKIVLSILALFQVLIASAIMWGASTLVSLHGEVSVISARIVALEAQMLLRMTDRYTGSDARRDQALTDSRFEDIKRRIEKLEITKGHP